MLNLMDAQSTSATDLVDQLQAQLRAAENLVTQLQQEKLEMKTDFENKRTKIKELYFAKESALREHNIRLLEAGQQISSMESTISSLRDEIENVKMIAAVSENTKEEAVEDINKHHQEEIESFRCVLQDSMEEQRSELVAQFDQERRRWELEKANMEKILKEEREKNNSKSQENGEAEDLLKPHESEISVRKAQLEAHTLEAVVLPLETEIKELKERLRLATELLEEKGTKQEHVVGEENQGDDEEQFLHNEGESPSVDKHICETATNDEVSKLSFSLSAEKSSRSDLEFYAEVINKQKAVLQKENDTLKTEMHEVCRLLEHEIEERAALSKTWKAANEEFINSQNLHQQDMKIVKSVVSRQLWKQIQMLQLQNEIDIQTKGLLPNGTEGETITDLNTGSCSLTTTPAHTPSDDDSFSQFQNCSINTQPSPTQESVSTTSTEYQDTISISSVSSLPSQASMIPEKRLRSQRGQGWRTCLTEELNLKRELNHMRELNLKKSRILSAPHLPQLVVEHQVVSSKEPKVWDQVPPVSCEVDEPSRDTANSTTSKQLNDKSPYTELERALEKEKKMRLQVEESVAYASEEAQKQINDLKKKLSDLESRMVEEKAWRRSKETEDDKRLAHLHKDRESLHAGFLQTKKEVDRLKSFHEKHRIDLSKEPVLPTNLEGLSSQVRIYRNAVLAARVERSDIQSRLQSQLSFLQDRLTAEQNAKEQLETTLLAELQDAKKKLSSLHDLQAKFSKESSARRDLLAQVEKDRILMASFRIKSEERNKALQEKLEAETSLREELDDKLLEAKNQISSLQDALKTSEHVQQDFVRLSQSLQVELEERRQQEEKHTDQSSMINPSQSSDVSMTDSPSQSTSSHPD